MFVIQKRKEGYIMASLKRVTHKNGRVVYRIVISLGYDKDGRKRTRSLTYSVDQSASPRQ